MLKPVASERLEMFVPDDAGLVASLLSAEGFGAVVGREVASDWPPLHWDQGPVGWIRAKMKECPGETFWLARLIALNAGPVVGTVGFKGPPDFDGFVEIGYSVVGSQWRRGIATEACGAMLRWAAGDPRVKGFRAHTLHGDPASSGVLRKLGFVLVATLEDPDDGKLDRFERPARGV
jgi:RimJ/RimL family protein N-acetyltransferase